MGRPKRVPGSVDCQRCGRIHERCTGHRNHRDDAGNLVPCRTWPIKGATVCRIHIGNGRANAEKRVMEAKAVAAAQTYGLPIDIDPHAAFLEEIARTVGHVRWLQVVIQSMDKEALVWGKDHTETHQSTGFQAGTYAAVSNKAAPSVWIDLYLKERSHLVKVCAAAINAGIAERQVRLEESQGALIASVISAFIEDPELGIPAEIAQRVARRHMLRLHGESAA